MTYTVSILFMDNKLEKFEEVESLNFVGSWVTVKYADGTGFAHPAHIVRCVDCVPDGITEDN